MASAASNCSKSDYKKCQTPELNRNFAIARCLSAEKYGKNKSFYCKNVISEDCYGFSNCHNFALDLCLAEFRTAALLACRKFSPAFYFLYLTATVTQEYATIYNLSGMISNFIGKRCFKIFCCFFDSCS